jgi:hypothetical protein
MRRGSAMKKFLFVTLALLIGSSAAQAAPLTDFVSNLLNSTNARSNWNGDSEKEPNGGYLFSFDCDINGDGSPELFIGSSLDAEGNACSWTVYKKGSGETYTALGNVVLNPTEGFYLASFNSVPQIKMTFVKPPDFGVIITYSLGVDNKFGKVSRKLSAAEANTLINDDRAEQIFELGQNKKPAVRKVLLAEYLKVSAIQWRPYKADLGILGQEKDPADATALKYTQQFTVDDAKALLTSRPPQ